MIVSEEFIETSKMRLFTPMKITFRRKWHWFFGGAFALLFCVLLSSRLGFFSENILDRHENDIAADAVPARDSWLTISQEGRRIGYAHRRFLPVKGGYRIIEEVVMRINTMGVVQPLSFRTEGDMDARMLLNSFNFVLNSSMFRFSARGTVHGKLLSLYVGSPGEEKKMEIILKEPLHLSAGLFEAARFAGLKTGESRIFHVFDPVALGDRPVRVTLSNSGETILLQGKTVRAKKFTLDFMGATQFAWLGDDGAVLKEKGILGITLEVAAKQEALKGQELWESADFTELASIPADKTIENPEAVVELKVKIANLDKTAFFLNGDRQTLQGDVLRIRKENLQAVISHVEIDKDSPSLKPSPLIQSNHPLIVSKARKITSGSDSDAKKAIKLLLWVNKNVKKRPVLSVPNALETLINLTGDCNEHAVLLAALARASGIPAEVEAGLVYLRGRFYYHAWNVLYIGGWVTADAVLGQMPADVTHIRFIRGSTERQMDMLGLMGRLHLEILDISQSGTQERERDDRGK
jgi:hypothetical protein